MELMNFRQRSNARPYVCEPCGKELWSLSEVVMFWDYFYCRECDPGTESEEEDAGESKADGLFLEGWDD